jgi:long-chain acyl-CoA synthetase
MLLHHGRTRAQSVAFREKTAGEWRSWTWSQTVTEVAAIAGGLAALGFHRGDRLAIIGDNRPRLYWAMAAAHALGGVAVPLDQHAAPAEMAFVLEHAGVRMAVAQGCAQVDRLLRARDGGRVPVHSVVVDDMDRLRGVRPELLHSFTAVAGRGRALGTGRAGWLGAEVAQGGGGDAAVILYVPGPSGRLPRGVVLGHANLLATARATMGRYGFDADDEVLACLPMAGVGDLAFSCAQALAAGYTVACPQSPASVAADLRDIAPTCLLASRPLWEAVLASAVIRPDDAGLHCARFGAGSGALYEMLVQAPLKSILGFGRLRLAGTADEAVDPQLAAVLAGLGIPLRRFYAMAEAGGFVAAQGEGQIRHDSVGLPLPGAGIRIAHDGEVQLGGAGVFHGYHRDPRATAAIRTPDGWLRTGRTGVIDDDGHLCFLSHRPASATGRQVA